MIANHDGAGCSRRRAGLGIGLGGSIDSVTFGFDRGRADLRRPSGSVQGRRHSRRGEATFASPARSRACALGTTRRSSGFASRDPRPEVVRRGSGVERTVTSCRRLRRTTASENKHNNIHVNMVQTAVAGVRGDRSVSHPRRRCNRHRRTCPATRRPRVRCRRRRRLAVFATQTGDDTEASGGGTYTWRPRKPAHDRRCRRATPTPATTRSDRAGTAAAIAGCASSEAGAEDWLTGSAGGDGGGSAGAADGQWWRWRFIARARGRHQGPGVADHPRPAASDCLHGPRAARRPRRRAQAISGVRELARQGFFDLTYIATLCFRRVRARMTSSWLTSVEPRPERSRD